MFLSSSTFNKPVKKQHYEVLHNVTNLQKTVQRVLEEKRTTESVVLFIHHCVVGPDSQHYINFSFEQPLSDTSWVYVLKFHAPQLDEVMEALTKAIFSTKDVTGQIIFFDTDTTDLFNKNSVFLFKAAEYEWTFATMFKDLKSAIRIADANTNRLKLPYRQYFDLKHTLSIIEQAKNNANTIDSKEIGHTCKNPKKDVMKVVNVLHFTKLIKAAYYEVRHIEGSEAIILSPV